MPDDSMYHATTPEIAARRKELAPHTHEAFEAFSRAVSAEMRAGGAYAHSTLALDVLSK